MLRIFENQFLQVFIEMFSVNSKLNVSGIDIFHRLELKIIAKSLLELQRNDGQKENIVYMSSVVLF